MRKPVELAHASRLINHGPTVLVTSVHGGRRNVMAAAWSMPVEFTPPRLAIVIDKSTSLARKRAQDCPNPAVPVDTLTSALDLGKIALKLPPATD
jgi:hypothetical protein